MMERMTNWSQTTAAAAAGDDDDDDTTSSTRRLIDVIVTSDHLQQSQWKFADVQYQLLLNDKRDGLVKQVRWEAVLKADVCEPTYSTLLLVL